MPKNLYEIVQRIPSHYVGESCIQIMAPYLLNKGFTMLNASGITYHYKPNSEFFVNKYLTDDRRIEFPYSQIPIHKGRKGLTKFEYANQLIDFEQVYIEIHDGVIKETYAVKDGDEALAATKIIMPDEPQSKIMNRAEVLDLIKSANGGLYTFEGSVTTSFELQSEDYILEWYKKEILKRREHEEKYSDMKNSDVTKFIIKSLEKLTIEDVPTDITLIDDQILVTVENKEIKSVQAIEIKFMGPDKYKVITYNFPITYYSKEHMLKLEQTNVKETKEPKFPRGLNKAINRGEIEKARQLVLTRQTGSKK